MIAKHLRDLEADAIYTIREALACCSRPVLLYSIGKDSSVLLHLTRKAVFPAAISFPLLHVDTKWKFREMIAFRDCTARELNLDLIVHTNQNGLSRNINPFDHGSAAYTSIMKTEALKQALGAGGFDAVFCGARRDEEKSRAKERVFSFRSKSQSWVPNAQRPELWSIYNTFVGPGESLRIFPLSDWTECDVWAYIAAERIPVVPLYFAAPRPVVRRGDLWIMVDDDRMRLLPGEAPEMRSVRFRTLGCYPLTAAIASDASDVAAVLKETTRARTSERSGRLIDIDQHCSMELKKREGYF